MQPDNAINENTNNKLNIGVERIFFYEVVYVISDWFNFVLTSLAYLGSVLLRVIQYDELLCEVRITYISYEFSLSALLTFSVKATRGRVFRSTSCPIF